MVPHYPEQCKIHVAVDCIIFGFDNEGLKVLLYKRSFEPFKGKWSLMGGFVGPNESLDDAARRVLYECSGLHDVFMEQIYTFGEVNRDPEARVVSVAYSALIRIDDYNHELNNTLGASWWKINALPELIFDHKQMIEKALNRLRERCKNRPIGFELLPKKFTLPQLIRLYEEIYQKKIDKRNFRKKILSMNLLKKLNEKDKSTSKRGAFLYQFDKKKYYKLLEKGFHFEL